MAAFPSHVLRPTHSLTLLAGDSMFGRNDIFGPFLVSRVTLQPTLFTMEQRHSRMQYTVGLRVQGGGPWSSRTRKGQVSNT